MASTLKQAHLEALRKIRDEIRDDISSGSASSYDEYKHKVGILVGLAMAEREFLDITSKLERE
tara:strand:+ start:716 stop:904 length:189 start_codon:yes stop_codon:yes gene_type:complete